ncbi:FecR family protein [Mucilaginibacter polytrichastri]|uniref:FecR protein domain-containing protein n=1 Tax=Mucilaginibacter polytrichastri TaxID=1302689 RepID=A0A1Q6A423_9SPHI|nr:FecR family protein [Mucilaginibacter polytrichastri]OKS88752.1 hypothetical protein RG47T_4230 [Mucilaginibacter polytrichastri]SFT05242.1 FecR family protein [Mucilaginibacter polytrichastri]
MNDDQKVTALFQKYLDLMATDDEKQEFLDYVEDPAYAELIQQLISVAYELQEEPAELSDPAKARVLQYIFKETETTATPAKVIRLWPRIAAAAAIIVGFSFGAYFILHKQTSEQQVAKLDRNDIAPGHNQATLTLANGQKIVLTKGLIGQLAKQNQTIINASQNNIVYQTNVPSAGQVVYNTLSTAIGEQSPYPLVLADGTKVWLNAASSITFPVAFNGKERLVNITGEAYFEVTHNESQPFRVKTETQTVEDLGTRFDINSYTDEPVVKTTLVDGEVRIQAYSPGKDISSSIKLKPGEQAQLGADQFQVQPVNATRITAWKDGNFRFQNDDIQTIMRQLARWYNIEVRYQGTPPKDKFSGRISRKSPISAVLHMMELTNHVHFKIEGRRVTVIQ